ncbi:MAG: hypothetical protein ACRCVG_03135 [Methanobacteriaceae archaeon]
MSKNLISVNGSRGTNSINSAHIKDFNNISISISINNGNICICDAMSKNLISVNGSMGTNSINSVHIKDFNNINISINNSNNINNGRNDDNSNKYNSYNKINVNLGDNMFNIFKKDKNNKKNSSNEDVLNQVSNNDSIIELNVEGTVDCLCDFTYNFYWNHKGKKMELDDIIPGTNYSYSFVVEHLKNGGSIRINGNAGHRLCSSMGVDLKYFGGTGKTVSVGNVFVEGDVSSRMGISMVKGAIYVAGKVTGPIGNIVEVKSDINKYRKFISITEVLESNLTNEKFIKANISKNSKKISKIELNDDFVRDTVGARLNKDCEIIVNNNVDLSTGILMKKGIVRVNGTNTKLSAGKNTAALLNGGTIIINGNCDDFTAVEMKKGLLIVNGDAGKFLGAKKVSGVILAKNGSSIHPTKKHILWDNDKATLTKYMINPTGFSKFE